MRPVVRRNFYPTAYFFSFESRQTGLCFHFLSRFCRKNFSFKEAWRKGSQDDSSYAREEGICFKVRYGSLGTFQRLKEN